MLPFTAECCDHSRRIREEQARLDGLLPDDSEPGRPYTEPAVEVEVGDGGVAPEGAGVGLSAAGPVSPTRTSAFEVARERGDTLQEDVGRGTMDAILANLDATDS